MAPPARGHTKSRWQLWCHTLPGLSPFFDCPPIRSCSTFFDMPVMIAPAGHLGTLLSRTIRHTADSQREVFAVCASVIVSEVELTITCK